MASLDFDLEKSHFREYYDSNRELLEDAKDTFINIVNTLLTQAEQVNLSKVEGRVKDREEAIRKFNVKYRKQLEVEGKEYVIADHISDLIAIRAVCLYEDDVEEAARLASDHLDVIEDTDKISSMESTEGFFGYKGLHMDLQLNRDRSGLAEYAPYSQFQFEIQIRTIIQDSWSVLDHKIKYKKSIPNDLKRRINTLSALFELADREFQEIRDSTRLLVSAAVDNIESDPLEGNHGRETQGDSQQKSLNAFNFLRIASHFYRDYEFEPFKVDNFVAEILRIMPGYRKGSLHKAIVNNRHQVESYKDWLAGATGKNKFNPFTAIRHCLYLSDKAGFSGSLTNASREKFDTWLEQSG